MFNPANMKLLGQKHPIVVAIPIISTPPWVLFQEWWPSGIMEVEHHRTVVLASILKNKKTRDFTPSSQQTPKPLPVCLHSGLRCRFVRLFSLLRPFLWILFSLKTGWSPTGFWEETASLFALPSKICQPTCFWTVPFSDVSWWNCWFLGTKNYPKNRWRQRLCDGGRRLGSLWLVSFFASYAKLQQSRCFCFFLFEIHGWLSVFLAKKTRPFHS